MTELPKPAFVTDEEIVKGGQAIVQAGDTTTGNVEKAVLLGELILDTPYAHVRYHMKDGDLLYHIFRGEAVPEKFWDSGEYGLVILAMAEAYWPMDKPKVEFHAETCRQEVYGDDPRETSRYPSHFYGAYLIVLPGVDRKLLLREERIRSMVDGLEDELKKSIAEWSNGS
jgi:hypothetical protein